MAEEAIELRAEQSRLRAALAAAEGLADTDQLTGLFNRRAFDRELGREIAAAARHGTALCMVYIDLDGFKPINDRFGHAMGDDALRRVALVLRETTRASDVAGRLGGDEFGVLLPRADLAAAERKARLITRRISEISMGAGEVRAPLSASAGAAEWRVGLDPAALVEAADRAMYARKRAARAAGLGAAAR